MLQYSKTLSIVLFLALATAAPAAPQPEPSLAADYFKIQTAQIASNCMAGIHSLADWQARLPELRRQAAEMLGLDPMPQRSDLAPVITARIERDDIIVENVCFQSLPGLYVTANLYLPRGLQKPAPAILYVCGHSKVITNQISCGGKAAYQHHGIWFAQNGYVCLVMDTVELGEIEGVHKGTYDRGMWWWNSRGYTPAAVETWNAIRALDYLDTRPEVNINLIGVTGISGGGAYSWFVAALDDRVKVIAPDAGITDLENYVVDNCVDNHCDCMFFLNTYRWDYPMLAALCAPRPLLLVNTDTDDYFPLSGVIRTYEKVRCVYGLYGVATNFGLVIGPGPHADTQNVQLPVLRWFNTYLMHTNPLIESAAKKLFSPLELRVLNQVPSNQINTHIHDTFVPAAPQPPLPASAGQWRQMRATWMDDLRRECFAGWPDNAGVPTIKRAVLLLKDGIQYEAYDIETQPAVVTRLCLARRPGHRPPQKLVLRATHGALSLDAIAAPFADMDLRAQILKGNTAFAMFYPRFVESNKVSVETKLRRHFMLIGQTLDGMRVWDIRRAIQASRLIPSLGRPPIWLEADGNLAVDAIYASLFEDDLAGVDVTQVPSSHRDGPDYLNIQRFLDIPQAAVMAADLRPLHLQPAQTNGWDFLHAMATNPFAHLKLQ